MGDGVLTLTDTYRSSLEGRVFTVPDTVHNTGLEIKLRVVKNDTGAAITAARNLCEFDGPDSLDFGRRVTSFGNAISGQGVVCKPLDDAYTVGQSIPDDDLFYVIEEGFGTVLTESGAVSLPAGTAVAANATGTLDGARAAAGQYVIGTMVETILTASTNAKIYVNAGLVNASA
jgi:hypothetical protein